HASAGALMMRSWPSDLIIKAPADAWLPAVEPFLSGLALPTAPLIALPPLPDLPPPPRAVATCREAFANYLATRSNAKAFATTSEGGCGTGIGRTIEEAKEKAIANCEAGTPGASCRLYAIAQHLAEN